MGHFQSTIKTTFSSSLRSGALRQWEPIFIGTKKDPTYDPRLTWEGRADKMVFVNLFIKKYIYLSVSCCTLWEAILARYLAFFQAIGSRMLEAFEFCIVLLYCIIVLYYYIVCINHVSWGIFSISVNVLNLHFTQIWLWLLFCRLKEWRCASESVCLLSFHHLEL